jgi:8-oxo-dGTP diphosphatase
MKFIYKPGITAAACVAFRKIFKGKEILIIKDEKWGGWIIPKGRVDPGESLEKAALRELEEETGFSGRIIRFLEKICTDLYEVREYYFYLIEVVGEQDKFKMDGSVKTIKWVSLDKVPKFKQFPSLKKYF